jgi:hypothetical protein
MKDRRTVEKVRHIMEAWGYPWPKPKRKRGSRVEVTVEDVRRALDAIGDDATQDALAAWLEEDLDRKVSRRTVGRRLRDMHHQD